MLLLQWWISGRVDTASAHQIASSWAVIGLSVNHFVVTLSFISRLFSARRFFADLMKRSLRIANVYARPTNTNMGHDTLRQSTANELGCLSQLPLHTYATRYSYGLHRIQNCATEIGGPESENPPSSPSKKRCQVVSKRRIYDSSTRNAASYPI